MTKSQPEFDVIVVGSGAAGGMSAYALSCAGVRVLMLEAGRDYDAVFLDPPFANVTPAELAEAVAALCGDRQVPLFVGYNLQRGAELVDAFASFDLRDTGDVLGYATGVMEGRISLFTNWRP